jgi:hypothetical protein
MPRTIRFTCVVSVAMLFSASMVSGQNTGRVARATFVDEAPTIDGFIDDAVWARAEPITGFVQQVPIEGNPATEKTEVRILYDERAIYIGAILYDSQPDEILITDSRRDSGLGGMDSFQIIFDTYHDRQNGFVFGTNVSGIEADGQVTNEGGGFSRGGRANANVGSGAGFNRNWDASWTVRTRVTEESWMAEFEIPLISLRYGSNPQVWGVNFQRNISRSQEQLFWAPIGQIYNLHRLSQAGELHGLELEAPRNLKITPYAVGSSSRTYADPLETEADLNGDFGIDVKYGVTPSLTLDLTYNTDFAQVEVDEQVVNLTRFNVRFPEKRPFFLENAGQFTAGKPGVDLFFSRRIGVDASTRAVVPILGGARMSGKAGPFNLGFLTMQTDLLRADQSLGSPRAVLTPYNNYSMLRLSRELPNRSSFGGIVLNRDAMGSGSASDDWNRTFGLDGRLGVGQYMDFRGFISRTVTPGESGDEMAYNIVGEYKRGGLDTSAEYTQIGDGFNPEVGFLRRGSFRSSDFRVAYRYQEPNVSWIRLLRPHTQLTTIWDLEGFLEEQIYHLHPLIIEFENGWGGGGLVDWDWEGFQAPFEISPGVVVPAGEYKYIHTEFNMNTDRRRSLSFSTTLSLGGFLSGNETSTINALSVRGGSKFSASIGWTRHDIDLPWGDFVTNLSQARFNYSFTPRVNFQSLIQYNDRDENWSGNLRFAWLNAAGAGSGLFVVYNATQALEGLGPINRTFIIKYSRQLDVLR